MTANNDNIMTVQDVHKSFPMGRDRQMVLQGVSLKVKQGEFAVITGASGSGKSTLLHIMGLLDRPDQGQVHFQGKSISQLRGTGQDRIRNRQIGFVFQFYHLLPELNVMENVMLPLMVETSLLRWPGQRKKARQRTNEILAAVGLSDKARQRPVTLSGGERQRTALARALIQNPQLLLADEPTGNLDSKAGHAILELLQRLNRDGQTIVMVTHDPAIADLADRKLILQDGKLQK